MNIDLPAFELPFFAALLLLLVLARFLANYLKEWASPP
jgi:hypothetical protein